jgi:hypothetical protein
VHCVNLLLNNQGDKMRRFGVCKKSKQISQQEQCNPNGDFLGRAVDGNKLNVTIRSQVQSFFNEKTIFTKLQFFLNFSSYRNLDMQLL